MKSGYQRVLEFGSRLDRLVIAEKMTPGRRKSLMDHLHASLQYGETEINSHERMSDDDLCDGKSVSDICEFCGDAIDTLGQCDE